MQVTSQFLLSTFPRAVNSPYISTYSKMKRKKEPARRSGRLALKSRRVNLPVEEFDQPIPSDSCSSNVPCQQRRRSRLKLKAMDDTYSKGHEENTKVRRRVCEQESEMMKAVDATYSNSHEENTKDGNHSWEHEEEMRLLMSARELIKKLSYQECRAEFHQRLADMVNRHYEDKGIGYHNFNARKIRGKLEIYEKRWFEQVGFNDKTMLSAKRIPLSTFHDVFASLFGEARVTVPRKRTSTGALKSSSTVDMNNIVPVDKETALHYLSAHSKCDSNGKSVETLMFSYILEDRSVLDAFVAYAKTVETYEERRKFLADLKAKGAVKIPQLIGINPMELPPDFR